MMTRALFVYKYCTMGGVETGMRFRMQHLRRHGVEAHALFQRDYGGRPAFRGMEDSAFFGSAPRDFANLIERNGYDVVSIIDSFDVLEWIRDLGYDGAVMVELRSTYDHTLVQLKRMNGHRLHAIVVPSEFQSQNVVRYLPRGIRSSVPRYVVPNYVDLTHFHPAPAAAQRPQRRILCWIGRIDPLKNWQEFLAIAQALADRDDLEFWMVGGGGSDPKRREEFRKAVGKTNLAARLRWWPLLNNAAMPALYQTVANSGGCVVLTTKCESFGFAALESIACGCPVVATRVGGLPEIIEHGQNGLLYTLGNVNEAVQAISTLLDDRNLWQRLADQGVATARDRFNPERCVARFAEVVNRACHAAASTADA